MRTIVLQVLTSLVFFNCICAITGPLKIFHNPVITSEDIIPQIKTIESVGESSDWWPHFRHDNDHTASSSSAAPPDVVRWVISLNASAQSPVVVNDKLYVSGSDRKIYCLNTVDGNILWSTPPFGASLGTPTIANGNIFVGIGSNISCLDATVGTLLWNTQVSGPVVSSAPTILDGRVFVGGGNTVYCLNVADGSVLWHYTTGGSVKNSPLVDSNRVYVSSSDKYLYCLDALGNSSNGTTTLLWRKQTNENFMPQPSLVLSNGLLYAFGWDRPTGTIYPQVFCFNASDGSNQWNFTDPANLVTRGIAPAIANGYVYIGGNDNLANSAGPSLYCVNAKTGGEKWVTPLGTIDETSVLCSPAIAAGKIYVGIVGLNTAGSLYCLDTTNGNILWNAPVGNLTGFASPAIANGCIYLQISDQQKIYCLGDLPPATPEKPSGPTTGSVGVDYSYSTSLVTDPEGDIVSYQFDWEDGTTSGWLSTPNAEKIWTAAGTYDVKVQAKDTFDGESDWSIPLSVVITGESELQLIISCPTTVAAQEPIFITITAQGAPISGATVNAFDESNVTNASGQVSFLAPSVSHDTTYFITASASGYAQAIAIITVTTTAPLTTGFIYGVISDTNGELLPESQITVFSDQLKKQGESDTEGRFSFSLPAGTYTVIGQKTGYLTSIVTNRVVEENKALEVNLVLAIEQHVPSDFSTENTLIQYTIQNSISQGKIGAQIYITSEKTPVVSTYLEDLTVQPDATQNQITMTVSAPTGTNATIVVVRISDTSFTTADDLKVLYDNVTLQKETNVEAFFSLEHTETASWLTLSSTDGVYVFVLIPHFSTHSIIIAPLGLTSGLGFLLYLGIASILAIITAIPAIRLWKKLE